jgi:hypothetical protein
MRYPSKDERRRVEQFNPKAFANLYFKYKDAIKEYETATGEAKINNLGKLRNIEYQLNKYCFPPMKYNYNTETGIF